MRKQLKLINMKRILFVFAIALTMVGCKEDNSIEGRITRAMKEYAKKNFDDPKSLIEITEIEKTEVLNVKDVLEEALNEDAFNDSIYKCKQVDLLEKMSSVLDSLKYAEPRIKGANRREQLASLCLDYASWIEEGRDKDVLLIKRNAYYDDINSVLMNDTLYSISLYDIKVRVKEDEKLRLKTYYTWTCDTTQIIKITNEPIKSESFEKEMDLMEKCEKVLKYNLELYKYIKRGGDIYDQFISLMY